MSKTTKKKASENGMNKSTLIQYISDQTQIAKTDTTKVINAMIDGIYETLMNGDKVSLIDLFTISVAKRAEKMGRNPQTGAPIKIAASIVPKIKATKKLKDALNKKKKK